MSPAPGSLPGRHRAEAPASHAQRRGGRSSGAGSSPARTCCRRATTFPLGQRSRSARFDSARAPPCPHDTHVQVIPEPQPQPIRLSFCPQQAANPNASMEVVTVSSPWYGSSNAICSTSFSSPTPALIADLSCPCPGCAVAGKASREQRPAAISNRRANSAIGLRTITSPFRWAVRHARWPILTEDW